MQIGYLSVLYPAEDIMAKWKRTKEQTMIYKILHRKLKIEQHAPPLKIGCELMCSGRVRRSCSTCGTRRVTLVTNQVISHERSKDRIVIVIDTRFYTNSRSLSAVVICSGERKCYQFSPDIWFTTHWVLLIVSYWVFAFFGNNLEVKHLFSTQPSF